MVNFSIFQEVRYLSGWKACISKAACVCVLAIQCCSIELYNIGFSTPSTTSARSNLRDSCFNTQFTVVVVVLVQHLLLLLLLLSSHLATLRSIFLFTSVFLYVYYIIASFSSTSFSRKFKSYLVFVYVSVYIFCSFCHFLHSRCTQHMCSFSQFLCVRIVLFSCVNYHIECDGPDYMENCKPLTCLPKLQSTSTITYK